MAAWWAHAQSTVCFISIDFVYRPAAAAELAIAIAIVEWLLHIIFHADILVKYLRSLALPAENNPLADNTIKLHKQFSQCCLSHCIYMCKYDTYTYQRCTLVICGHFVWLSEKCMDFGKCHHTMGLHSDDDSHSRSHSIPFSLVPPHTTKRK